MPIDKPWEGREPTKEDAVLIGERLGALVAAEIVSQPVRGTIAKFVQLGEELESYELLYGVLYDAFIRTFQDLTAVTPEGMAARTETAKFLMEDAAIARQRVSEMTMAAVKTQDVDEAPTIELTLLMAEESLSAANKLFGPVMTNIQHLIETAKSVEVMQGMQRKARAQMEDESHDHKCDNPECKGHTNH